jgi:succinate--hydroxymethylglutarate CoA-transferase
MIAEVQPATIGTARVINSPVKLSDTPASVRTAPPTLGQHTTAVLSEVGYDRQEIEELRTAGVI